MKTDPWANVQANISLLFGDLPFVERPAAAARAGFTAVECWWPFSTAAPGQLEIDGFISAIEDAGVQLSALNFFAGDMAAGERGIVSHPSRRSEFDDNVAVVSSLASRLGVRSFNALYGNRVEGLSAAHQDDHATETLAAAAAAVAAFGGVVLVEPVSGVPAYPLKRSDDVFAVISRTLAISGGDNVRLLADFYHLTVNGEDCSQLIAAHSNSFGHVQIADAPGRHEPGTGNAHIVELVSQLAGTEYEGAIGLEYVPSGDTEDGLAWLRAVSPDFGAGLANSQGEVRS